MPVRQHGHKHGAGALVLRKGREFRTRFPDQPDHGVVQGGAAPRLQVQGRHVLDVHRGVDALVGVIELREREPAPARHCLLFADERREPAHSVIGDGAHRPGTVQEDVHVRQG